MFLKMHRVTVLVQIKLSTPTHTNSYHKMQQNTILNKGARWLLLKRPENLTDKQAIKLSELLRYKVPWL